MKPKNKLFFLSFCVLYLSSCWAEEQSLTDTLCSRPSSDEIMKVAPNSVHEIFLLGEQYQNSKDYLKAISCYKARISQEDTDKTEIWSSLYRTAQCYRALDEWNQALDYYLQAYEQIPEIANPIEEIATYYRLHKKNYLAYLFAKLGQAIPYPEQYASLTAKNIYDYRFDEELLIVAYYTHFRPEGLIAGDRLNINREVSEDIKNKNRRNLLYYVQNLPDVRFQPITFTLPLIGEKADLHYNPLNPSILKTKEGFWLSCRTINYTSKGAIERKMIDPTKEKLEMDNKNYLLQYDKNFTFLSQSEILDHNPLTERSGEMKGLEDLRIFIYNNGLHGTASMLFNGVSIMTLNQFGDRTIEGTVPLESTTLLQGLNPQKNEKNWLPFIREDVLLFIYAYDPLTIYKLDKQSGNLHTVVSKKQKRNFSHFHGSAGPISFDDGYLIIVHEAIKRNEYCYIHRFIYLDKEYNITKISLPFTYKHQGIECCCGMTIDHAGKDIIMTVGIEDKEAYLAFIALDKVRALLQPIL